RGGRALPPHLGGDPGGARRAGRAAGGGGGQGAGAEGRLRRALPRLLHGRGQDRARRAAAGGRDAALADAGLEPEGRAAGVEGDAGEVAERRGRPRAPSTIRTVSERSPSPADAAEDGPVTPP